MTGERNANALLAFGDPSFASVAAMTNPFTFGIEEEFFVVDPATRNPLSRVPRAFLAACQSRFGDVIGPELLDAQIEISSPIFHSTVEAANAMRVLRGGLVELARENGLALIAAGTHPMAAWHEQTPTDTPRYRQLVDDFQIVGRRNLFSGLHVHVGVPDGVDRVRLMNRAMRWVPLFLALSTSSPFWNRQRTGLLSYRQAAYDEWPRSGVPDYFDDEAALARHVDRLARVRAVADASWLWWIVRPSARYPTLELRVTDACTRLDDALAIAALYRALIAMLVRRPEVGTLWHGETRALIDENRWRAKRHGLAANFICEATLEVASAGEWLERLLVDVGEDIARFDAVATVAPLATLPSRGTSAHCQLARFGARRAAGASRSDALRAVVDWLIETTATTAPADEAGEPYTDEPARAA